MQTVGSTLKIPATGIVRLDPENLLLMYYIRDAYTLTNNVVIYVTNTPSKPCVVQVAVRKEMVDLNGFFFTFFGRNLTQDEFDTGGILRAFWTGFEWIVQGIGFPAIGTPGADGREIEFSQDDRWLLWRYVGDVAWNQLFPYAEINVTVNNNAEWKGDYVELEAAFDAYLGDVGYIYSDGTVHISDSDNETVAVVMCADASIMTGAVGKWLVYGTLYNNAWNWEKGLPLFITSSGTTGNTLAQAAPTEEGATIQVIGYALTDKIVSFLPTLVWMKRITCTMELELATLKVGDIAGGNFTEFEADGTMVFHGDAKVTKDELGSLISKRITSPSSRIQINDAEATLTFNNNTTLSDYVTENYQFNHDWDMVDVDVHFHWPQAQAAMPNWLMQYRWQLNGELETSAWTSVAWSANVFTWTTGRLNQITKFPAMGAPIGVGVSAMLQVRLLRDTGNASGKFGGADPVATAVDARMMDIHRQSDTLGSRTPYSK